MFLLILILPAWFIGLTRLLLASHSLFALFPPPLPYCKVVEADRLLLYQGTKVPHNKAHSEGTNQDESQF